MRPRLAVALGLLVAAVGGSLAVYVTSGPKPARQVTRAELASYEAAVLPVVKDGGKVVQLGMKPALEDLTRLHIVPPLVIASEGDGWVRTLQSVRARLARVKTPAALQDATISFQVALDRYIAAAREFTRAARSTGNLRGAAVQRGVSLARSADQAYDRGAAVIQASRHALGLTPNPNFPEASDG